MSRPLKVLGEPASGDGPWYADGVRFSCTGSGKCCTVHGDYAYVFLSREEERRIAQGLGLTLRRFRKQHTYRPFGQGRSLRFPDGRCTFLRERQCSIYETRPQQCRTWPFWEENLDPQVWQDDVASFCPGVGRGRLYTAEEIEAVMSGDEDISEES
jgi:Fe-S-cluster containining protein